MRSMQVQGQPNIHREFQASRDYTMRFFPRKTNKQSSNGILQTSKTQPKAKNHLIKKL